MEESLEVRVHTILPQRLQNKEREIMAERFMNTRNHHITDHLLKICEIKAVEHFEL